MRQTGVPTSALLPSTDQTSDETKQLDPRPDKQGPFRVNRTLEPPASLEALLRQASDGDEVAFAAVYDATASRVFGLALRVVRDRAQAEEVAQEAYLQAWRNAARFDEDRGTALAWMMKIVHSQAVDRVRSAQASRTREVRYYRRDLPSRPIVDDPTHHLCYASLEAQRVRNALAELSPVQRECLELAYFEGYSYAQVAKLIGVPTGTVKTRIRDGMIRLRKLMCEPNEQ